MNWVKLLAVPLVVFALGCGSSDKTTDDNSGNENAENTNDGVKGGDNGNDVGSCKKASNALCSKLITECGHTQGLSDEIVQSTINQCADAANESCERDAGHSNPEKCFKSITNATCEQIRKASQDNSILSGCEPPQ